MLFFRWFFRMGIGTSPFPSATVAKEVSSPVIGPQSVPAVKYVNNSIGG